MNRNQSIRANVKLLNEKDKISGIFLNKIKHSIFGVFYVILKEGKKSYLAFILFHFIEFLQILSYSFSPAVNIHIIFIFISLIRYGVNILQLQNTFINIFNIYY
jgi:hypothetical protein